MRHRGPSRSHFGLPRLRMLSYGPCAMAALYLCAKRADEIDAAQAALARHTQANMEVEVERVLETARARGCLA